MRTLFLNFDEKSNEELVQKCKDLGFEIIYEKSGDSPFGLPRLEMNNMVSVGHKAISAYLHKEGL